MIENLENFTNYLGANRYQAQSICLTSDYVLVKMYTIFYGVIGLTTLFLGITLFITYRNSEHMLRVAIVLLRDPWIMKLFALLFLVQGFGAISSVATIHYAVYYADLMLLGVNSAVASYAVWRVLSVIFDRERQETILDELVPGGVPDYDFQPTEQGESKVQLPLTHFDNKKVGKIEKTDKQNPTQRPNNE